MAEAALRGRLRERPEDAEARCRLAELVAAAGDRTEALALLEEGVAFSSTRADRLAILAEGMLHLRAVPEAISALQAAARLAPEDPALPARLAGLWAVLGERERAEGFASRARSLGREVSLPDIAAGPNPAMARHLFDQYAVRFERHLRDDLRYGLPELIAATLAPITDGFAGGLVIDLGCGTGLMAPHLRGWAGELVGVDVSPRMLELARQRQVYDRLIEGEAVEYLAGFGATASLVVAADVLDYVGDLVPLCTALAAVLGQDGLFVASTQRGEGDGVTLNAGRFAHSHAYLQQVARDTGFALASCDEIVPRHDNGEPVRGWLFVMRPAA